MKKTIVLISNPFGFGPTGKAVAVAEEFLRRGYTEIVFIGNSFVQEIVNPNFKKIIINERDKDQIKDALLQIENPFVISSQNRFAIYAAKELGIPSAFIDGLSWFWKDIPEDHFLADNIFWMKYPDIEKKIPPSIKEKIYLTPAIINYGHRARNRSAVLLHLGGCKNPIYNIFPSNYLDLIIDTITSLKTSSQIQIAGGKDVLDYIRNKINCDNIIFIPQEHDEFVKYLSNADHFVTTAGQTATLEAFSLGIPTSFMPPMNLSQLALMDLLNRYNSAPQSILWSHFIDNDTDLYKLSEKDAIGELSKLAQSVKNNKNMHDRFVFELDKLINNIPNNYGQTKFINNLGVNGASVVCDILINKWELME